ncbi:MAG TPA: hypothetical protein VMZ03_09750 [Chitinophagaceae bacterium]|nr:hypothetical protein [Chitinophagaceae bacterium]
MKRQIAFLSYIAILSCLLTACQKETGSGGGTNPPAIEKPKPGTAWTYSYYTFNSDGSLHTTETVVYKAKTQETIGGETWLKVVNNANDTLVYYLKQKADGLYQYANNASNLFCKYPAALNEAYTSYNAKGVEDFVVKGVNDILPTNIGDIKVNYYEGTKVIGVPAIIDNIWFNDNAWIVRHIVYRKNLLSGVYYKYSSLFIQSIVY